MKLKNKVSLVTGSSKGIGRATIIELAKQGSDVVINYNTDLDGALSLVNEIAKYNVKSVIIKCDISNEDEVKSMIDKVIDEFGRIDILVNNAGIAIDTTFEDKTKENFMKILEVNLVGTFLVSKYVGVHMLNQKSGKIVNISSDAAINKNYPESLDYDASKAGVISLTKNLAKQYAPYINVNCVAPGWVDTNMNKELDQDFINEENNKILLNRFAKPVEIAKVISFLVTDDASYINSEVIKVDGGFNG